MLATLGALTAVATVTTLATLWTVATLTTVGVLTALPTGRTLDITLGLLNKHTMRELVLTCLRVNLKEFHLNVVTLLDTSLFDGLKALPVNLRDVEQTVLARQELNEASVWHD